MYAIYQHRTDNEVPGRLPVALDNDGGPPPLSWASRRRLRVTGGPAFRDPRCGRSPMKKRRARPHGTPDASRDNLRRSRRETR